MSKASRLTKIEQELAHLSGRFDQLNQLNQLTQRPSVPTPSARLSTNYAHELRPTVLTDRLRWPLLTRATEVVTQAQNTKVEWVVGSRTEYNYTQIFRQPFDASTSRHDAHYLLLDRMEHQLRHGVRKQIATYRTFGSVESLIKRWPTKKDTVRLCVLRNLILYDYPDIFGSPRHEWLIECSVMAFRH